MLLGRKFRHPVVLPSRGGCHGAHLSHGRVDTEEPGPCENEDPNESGGTTVEQANGRNPALR